jgi:hypothetical protein
VWASQGPSAHPLIQVQGGVEVPLAGVKAAYRNITSGTRFGDVPSRFLWVACGTCAIGRADEVQHNRKRGLRSRPVLTH